MNVQILLPTEYIITYLIFFGGIGFLIYGGVGALFGIFLGPIGLAIAAIFKLKGSIVSSTEKDSSKTKDIEDTVQKWKLLISVDPEVRDASKVIERFCLENGYNNNLAQKMLAQRYFKLNEKKYLAELVSQIKEESWEKMEEGVEIKKASGKIAKLSVTKDNQYCYKSDLTGQTKIFDSIEEARKYFK